MQSSPPNLGGLIILGLCFWAAGKDSAYKRAGGIKPTRLEKNILISTIVGCSALIFLIFELSSPEAAGTGTGLLTVLVFGFWEIDRYRIRRKHPVGGMK